VNSLLLASAILGPNAGPVYSGCFWVYKQELTLLNKLSMDMHNQGQLHP